MKGGGGKKRGERGGKKERGGKVGHPWLSRQSLLSFSVIAVSKQVLDATYFKQTNFIIFESFYQKDEPLVVQNNKFVFL